MAHRSAQGFPSSMLRPRRTGRSHFGPQDIRLLHCCGLRGTVADDIVRRIPEGGFEKDLCGHDDGYEVRLWKTNWKSKDDPTSVDESIFPPVLLYGER